MKVRKMLSLLLVACVAALTLVSCSNDAVQEASNVSFIPSNAKALNQSGTSTGLALDVNSYYWEYYCKQVTNETQIKLTDLKINTSLNSPEWVPFKNSDKTTIKESGLGIIPDLIRDSYYVFGLRAFAIGTPTENKTDAAQVLWLGYQYAGSSDNNSLNTEYLKPVKLSSKTTLVTIDVFSVGKGNLFFSISAPNSGNWTATHTIEYQGTSEAETTTVEIPKNRFAYTYQKLGSTTEIGGTHYLEGDNLTYSTTTDCFIYQTPSDDPIVFDDTGTYLFTVWQQYWNEENAYWDDTAGEWKGGEYSDSDERRQILIVNILQGVDTVIAGTLDSTSLETLDYEGNGYTEGESHNLWVRFHSPNAGRVDEMTVTAYRVLAGNTIAANADNKYVSARYGNHIVRLADPTYEKSDSTHVDPYSSYNYDGDSVIITWSPHTTDTDLAFYVNGEKLSRNADGTFNTDVKGYIYLAEEYGTDGANKPEIASTYVRYDAANDWLIAETIPVVTKTTQYPYFAYIISIKDNNVDTDRASDEESVCFTITNEYVAVTSITIMCNGEELPIVSGSGDDAVRGITLSSTPKAQLVDNGWQTAMGSTPLIYYYTYDTATSTKGGLVSGDSGTYSATDQANAETYIAAHAGTYVAEISAGDQTVSLLLESPES